MHPILRRTALAATALLFASSAALAQANGWPKQPITLIMGFPAGSGVDVVARAVQVAIEEGAVDLDTPSRTAPPKGEDEPAEDDKSE